MRSWPAQTNSQRAQQREGGDSLHPLSTADDGAAFFSMFLGGGFVVLSLSQGLAAQRNAYPGFLAGICVAAWSIAVAAIMPLIGRMFDQRDYRHAFLLFALMPAVGTIVWQTLRPKLKTLS